VVWRSKKTVILVISIPLWRAVVRQVEERLEYRQQSLLTDDFLARQSEGNGPSGPETSDEVSTDRRRPGSQQAH
jgi:hypothetical protein